MIFTGGTLNILFSTNSNYMQPTKVFLYSVCESHKEKKIDFWLAYHDMTDQDIMMINDVLSIFEGKTLHLIDVGAEFADKIKEDVILPPETFYRILALEMLPEDIRTILYLDVDMIVKKDISELFDISLEGHPFAACEDINAHVGCVEVNASAKIPYEKRYFNAGCILFNLDYWRRDNNVSKIVDRICNEYQNFLYLDQDILNNQFYDDVLYIPWSKYNLHPVIYVVDLYAIANGEIKYATYYDINGRDENFDIRYKDITDIVIENASIIHYISDSKPWRHRGEEIYVVHEWYRHFWLDYEFEMVEKLKAK